jgi:hypothetical protein
MPRSAAELADAIAKFNPDKLENLEHEVPDFAPGVAQQKMDAKAKQLGDLPGDPLDIGFPGVESVPGGWRRHYQNGTMYMRRGQSPHFLGLAAAEHYDRIGNTRSYLGFPDSDVEFDPEDGESGLVQFEKGTIYFWGDIGPFDIQHVKVRYVGFHCFGRTDEPSASDEPFWTIGVLPLEPTPRQTIQTVIYEGIDSGESRNDPMDLFKGLPTGVILSVNLGEHDQGDPHAYKENVERAVDRAADRLIKTLGHVPVVGPLLALVAEVAFMIGGPALKEEITELLGTEDDHLGSHEIVLPTKELLRLTRQPRQIIDGVGPAQLATPLISGKGSSYKAYFDVEAVTY